MKVVEVSMRTIYGNTFVFLCFMALVAAVALVGFGCVVAFTEWAWR